MSPVAHQLCKSIVPKDGALRSFANSHTADDILSSGPNSATGRGLHSMSSLGIILGRSKHTDHRGAEESLAVPTRDPGPCSRPTVATATTNVCGKAVDWASRKSACLTRHTVSTTTAATRPVPRFVRWSGHNRLGKWRGDKPYGQSDRTDG